MKFDWQTAPFLRSGSPVKPSIRWFSAGGNDKESNDSVHSSDVGDRSNESSHRVRIPDGQSKSDGISQDYADVRRATRFLRSGCELRLHTGSWTKPPIPASSTPVLGSGRGADRGFPFATANAAGSGDAWSTERWANCPSVASSPAHRHPKLLAVQSRSPRRASDRAYEAEKSIGLTPRCRRRDTRVPRQPRRAATGKAKAVCVAAQDQEKTEGAAWGVDPGAGWGGAGTPEGSQYAPASGTIIGYGSCICGGDSRLRLWQVTRCPGAAVVQAVGRVSGAEPAGTSVDEGSLGINLRANVVPGDGFS